MNMKKIHDDRDNGYPDDDSMKPLRLSPHPNFENALVNLDQSAIHVPINVYEVIYFQSQRIRIYCTHYKSISQVTSQFIVNQITIL